MSIRERDNGAKSLMKRLQKKAVVRVGVMGAEASQKHGKGETVADVAAFHELGLGVPKRSFISDYVDENESNLMKRMRAAGERMLKGDDLGQQAGLFGVYVQGQIQERISNGIDPPLKQKTIDRKGSETPLIDTGQLRSSITWEAEVKSG